MTSELLLDLNHVQTVFDIPSGRVNSVNDVSFSLKPGTVLGIVGESGSGKSVTARTVMRMLRSPGKTVGGTIEFAGRDLLALPEDEMRQLRGKDIAMVFQDPQSALNPVVKVGDQIAEALTVKGVSKAAARERAKELLAQVGIPDVDRNIDLYPHQFSGGMRQRVVIAIALANTPSLLIADEPTTALDVTIQAQILRLLNELRAELGVAIMMITHDMGVVAEMCDEVVVMYGGRVVEKGSVRDILTAPKHPYTAALLKAVPRLTDTGDDLVAIPGSPPDPQNLPEGCAFHPRCQVARAECRVSTPKLLPVATGQLSACFVAQDGEPVSVPAEREETVSRRTVGLEPVLTIEDVRVNVATGRKLIRKEDPVYAVDGLSLEVFPGQTLGLVGESGCGKSTLSRAVVGINKTTEGRVLVTGQDVTAMNEAQSRHVIANIQYVFQDPYASLNPRRTVAESLAEAIDIAGDPTSDVRARSIELLERVGLNANQLDRLPHEFSGGQRQRIGIARALAGRPKVLILDEPVSALDVSIQAQIIKLLEELRDDLGLGYLFIAHDLAVVKRLSDRLAVMYLGRIVEIGDAATVYSTPQHPYTTSLLSSTPEPDLDRDPSQRIVLTGDLPSPAHPPSGCPFRTRCPIGPLFREGRSICEQERPDLRVTATGQMAACHFPGELKEGMTVSG